MSIAQVQPAALNAQAPLLSMTVTSIDGTEVPLSQYKGKVLLIVNTASMCGNTPQYASLEKLYEKYKDKGLRILAFPANNFGAQEPGTNDEIKQFCTSKYNVTFDLFSKISVKGDDIHPLYSLLTTSPGVSGDIKWNFTKFVVDRGGNIVARFEPKVDPLSSGVVAELETLLGG